MTTNLSVNYDKDKGIMMIISDSEEAIEALEFIRQSLTGKGPNFVVYNEENFPVGKKVIIVSDPNCTIIPRHLYDNI